MDTIINTELLEVINAVHYRPALSLILPLQAEIGLRKETKQALKIAADKAEKELTNQYPAEHCAVIMKKLSAMIDKLDIPTNKMGLAIYVSPIFEKAVFLNHVVEEKIIVDESFEIRDLVYSAKQQNNYLLLTLSSTTAKLFRYDSGSLIEVASNLPESIEEFINDAPEKVANFSDSQERKQVVVEKFLHHVDVELGRILSTQQRPVVVLTTEKIIGHFKKLTHHAESIIGYAKGYTNEATWKDYIDLIKPQLDRWMLMQEEKLLLRLDQAASRKLLVTGIINIWEQVSAGKSGHLVVERNYRFAAQRGPVTESIEPISEPYNEFSYIRDAVDDVMEMLLKKGDDISFVEDGRLASYGHIALISHY